MAFDVTAFTTDILKDIKLDETQRQSLNAILSDPTVARRLEESTLRQSDYSKQINELQDKRKNTEIYWNRLVEADQRIQTREKELAGIDPDLTSSLNANSKGVSEEKLQELAKQAVAYNNAVTRLSMQHYKEFGDILNLDDVVKTSAENGNININLAYDKYVQPKRDETNQKKIKELVEQARAEGKKEAEANFKPPTLEAPMGIENPSLDALSQKTADRAEFGSLAAVKAWREARTKGTIVNTVL